jgi:hypothetical protein
MILVWPNSDPTVSKLTVLITAMPQHNPHPLSRYRPYINQMFVMPRIALNMRWKSSGHRGILFLALSGLKLNIWSVSNWSLHFLPHFPGDMLLTHQHSFCTFLFWVVQTQVNASRLLFSRLVCDAWKPDHIKKIVRPLPFPSCLTRLSPH